MSDYSVVNVVSKIVTKFLLDTCLLQQPSDHHVRATAWCFTAVALRLPDSHSLSPDDRIYMYFVPLLTGSSAEFYLQPMLSDVGDIDVMVYVSSELAIPVGYPPPTELPAEFHSRVLVFEIIDNEYPGYVYLMSSYLLTEDADTGEYNNIGLQCDQRCYWTTGLFFKTLHMSVMDQH